MEPQIFSQKPEKGGVWDVVIVGSGPAALTAAIYTTRGAASTLILAGEKWGGQLMLTTTVDNFPGFPEGIQGPDLIAKMKDQAIRFGAEFLTENAEGSNFTKRPLEVKTNSDIFLAKSVIIATGALTRWLEAPGVERLIGRGISSCAPCDAPFFKAKNVAVVGGGDSAMEEALVLTRYANSVTIIHRRDEFRASQAMQKKVLENPKIKILWSTEVIEVKGESKLESVSLRNNKTNETTDFAIDGLFVAIGHKPDSDIFARSIKTDEKGYIEKTSNLKPQSSNENQYSTATSVPGVFVAGDVHDNHYKQAVTAAGFGCMAGMDSLKYLEEVRSMKQ